MRAPARLCQMMNSPPSIKQSFRALRCAASIATSSAQDGATALQRRLMLGKLEIQCYKLTFSFPAI